MGRCCRIGMRQLDQYQQPRVALNQRAYRTLVERAFDQVALPMPRELTIFNLWRTNMDAQQVRHMSTAIFSLGARPALGACHAQTSNELFAQLSSGLGVDNVVDGFMRGALGSIAWMQFSQVRCNLLG